MSCICLTTCWCIGEDDDDIDGESECQACFSLLPNAEMVHNKGCGHRTLCKVCLVDMLKSNLDDYSLRLSVGMMPECPEEGCHEPVTNVAALLAKEEPKYFKIFEQCLVSLL